MKKGDVLTLDIDKYAFEGKGIAKINKEDPHSDDEKNYVVFVNGAYPGDKVTASLRKIKKSYSEAKVETIISPSPLRTEARCEYFGTCGGCKQQDMNYESQAKYKQEQTEEIFRRMGGFDNFETLPVIHSDKIYFYRNKMEFSFAEKRWLTEEEIKTNEVIDRNFALGLHIPNIFDKVLDIKACYLQSELSTRILNFTRSFFKSREISIYSSEKNSGYLRNLVIRQSAHTDDLMVNLVTFTDDEKLMNEYTDELLKAAPEVTTVVNNINLKKAMIAAGDYEKVYYGSGVIYDHIGDYRFRISAGSFFQTNTYQAEKLYRTALDFAELKGDETIYDLYSGAGTISIFISSHAKDVYAFESVESAVKDAEANKLLNEITNVHFITADLYKTFLPVIKEKNIPHPEIILVDPPRSGMHKNTVDDVLQLSPEKIVYVSCNPTTQVRDIKLFSESGYHLKKIQPVDMFPQTFHIENVALLIKGK
jgi:23S rRNA (uracil1939-C5)-methyltransferase